MEKNIGIGRKIGKKILVMLVAFTMLFSVAMFSGCTNDNSEILNELAQLRELIEEKSDLSQQLQDLTDLVNGMKEDNEGLAGKIEALQGSIDSLAKRLGGLEAGNEYLLGKIKGLQEQVDKLQEKLRELKDKGGDPVRTFPAVLEDFDLAEFTEEFFKNSTLVLVPFVWRYRLHQHLDFYTTFIEDGEINFLVEVTCPFGWGQTALDGRLFAVIISDTILNKYKIGQSVIFETYTFSGKGGLGQPDPYRTKNNRDFLSEVRLNSIESRVSFVPPHTFIGREGITAIASLQNFEEHLRP